MNQAKIGKFLAELRKENGMTQEQLAEKLNVEITSRIASLLYAGIIGDTNCFQNDNINEHTFLTAAGCIKYGADKNNVTFIFQKHQTYEELKWFKGMFDDD